MATKRHPNGYWTYETCYEEAKKYNSRNEFKHGSNSAYNAARKNNWIDDYTWLEIKIKPNGYWDSYDNCYEEAKKYKSRSEFYKGQCLAYDTARINGWLDDYVWFEKPTVHNKKWYYNTCFNEAKKYKSKGEFKKYNAGAYKAARKNGWLNDYVWFERKQKDIGYWNTYEHCYEEAKKYKSRVDFQKNNRSAYQSALKNGWLDDYKWFVVIKKPNGYWDYDNCYEEAKKYKSKIDFFRGNGPAYAKASKNQWINDYTWLEYTHIPKEYRFNLLEEFISEYEFRTFLENNDQNILLIIIRNLEPKYEPIKKDLEKALARTKETDPIKALRDKYMSDDEEQDVNDETENTGDENVHDINTIDMDDDEAFKAVMTEITESSEESEEKGEKEEKELSIDDVVKNDETELKVINKIEHMLTPEDRQYIMDKFLNDRRRQWMAEREKKSCNA